MLQHFGFMRDDGSVCCTMGISDIEKILNLYPNDQVPLRIDSKTKMAFVIIPNEQKSNQQDDRKEKEHI